MKDEEERIIGRICKNCRKYRLSIGRCEDPDWNAFVPATDTCWKWERRNE